MSKKNTTKFARENQNITKYNKNEKDVARGITENLIKSEPIFWPKSISEIKGDLLFSF